MMTELDCLIWGLTVHSTTATQPTLDLIKLFFQFSHQTIPRYLPTYTPKNTKHPPTDRILKKIISSWGK